MAWATALGSLFSRIQCRAEKPLNADRMVPVVSN